MEGREQTHDWTLACDLESLEGSLVPHIESPSPQLVAIIHIVLEIVPPRVRVPPYNLPVVINAEASMEEHIFELSNALTSHLKLVCRPLEAAAFPVLAGKSKTKRKDLPESDSAPPSEPANFL